MKRIELKEVDEPNLCGETFPHDDVPRIRFDSKHTERIGDEEVTFDFSKAAERDIFITDTTFRDGQQARPPFSVKQTVDLYKLLVKLTGGGSIIRNTEFFVYGKKDREAVEACQAVGAKFPEVTGWIRADQGDLSIVKKMGLKETGMLTSSSDYHIFLKQKSTRRGAFEKYTACVKVALEAGIRVRCHLEDVTRADIDGFVLPFVQEVVRLSEEVPDDIKPRIRLCDTMGFGLPYAGAELPRSIPKLVWRMIHDGGIPSERLEWHGHDDFHKVLVNATTAWLCGCDALNGTLLGIGERTGNPPLEGAVFEYIGIKGRSDGLETLVLREIADYFEKEIGYPIPHKEPFVGRDFNKTRAGIHAGGLYRDHRVYNIFDTEKILGVPPSVAITDKSGSDGVAYWVNSFLGLEGKDRLGKTKLVKIMRWVEDQYERHGRTTAVSDEEMEELVKEHLPKRYAEVKGTSA